VLPNAMRLGGAAATSLIAYPPLIRLMRVVLPAPFGPIMARISPLCTSRLRWRNAWTPPKAFETLSMISSGRPSVPYAIALHLHGYALHDRMPASRHAPVAARPFGADGMEKLHRQRTDIWDVNWLGDAASSSRQVSATAPSPTPAHKPYIEGELSGTSAQQDDRASRPYTDWNGASQEKCFGYMNL
jgi:hypothetical protein